VAIFTKTYASKVSNHPKYSFARKLIKGFLIFTIPLISFGKNKFRKASDLLFKNFSLCQALRTYAMERKVSCITQFEVFATLAREITSTDQATLKKRNSFIA